MPTSPVRVVIEVQVEDKDWGEWSACLGEQEFYASMRNAWTLYVDLGPNRKALARQVLGELAHIPRSGSKP